MSTQTVSELPGHESSLPLVAILRGITVDDAIDIAEAIVGAGISLLEVPLNSPCPIESIAAIVNHFGDEVACGGGTVLSAAQVDEIKTAGGRLVVSPNCDERVISHSLKSGMTPVPGVATPTEALSAIGSGARILKLFPAAGIGEIFLDNMMAVIPPAVKILAVGGINSNNMGSFWCAGARGFGVGGAIYQPGESVQQVAEKVKDLVAAFRRTISWNTG